MKPLSWKIGDIEISQIVEMDLSQTVQNIIPKATKENVLKTPWLVPNFADQKGGLKAVVQSFIVETKNKIILVDSCVGNGKSRTDMPECNNLQTNFLDKLERAGYKREKINIVICTHLHFDHVGWNTMYINGLWQPTFPNAHYLFVKKEFEYWKSKPTAEIADDRAAFDDSVLPVFNAGLAHLVSPSEKISDEISLIPTPGHTPYHVSVFLNSKNKSALITGDMMHHPCQIAHPTWETVSDSLKSQGRQTRKQILNRFTNTDTLIIGSHFSNPVAGYVVSSITNYVFKP